MYDYRYRDKDKQLHKRETALRAENGEQLLRGGTTELCMCRSQCSCRLPWSSLGPLA